MAYNDMQNHIGMQRPQTSGGDRGVQGVRGGGALTERLVVRPHNTAVVPKKKTKSVNKGVRISCLSILVLFPLSLTMKLLCIVLENCTVLYGGL